MNPRHLAFSLAAALALPAASVAEAHPHDKVARAGGHHGRHRAKHFNRQLFMSSSGAVLGVNVTDITTELREHFGAPSNAGVLVARVGDDGAAAKGGVKVGDIIVAVQGESIDSSWDLIRAIGGHEPGADVQVDVVRDGRRNSLSVKLDERTDDEGPGGGFGRGFPFQGGLRDFHFEMPDMPDLPNRPGKLDGRLKKLEERLKRLEQKL